jgi:hypothetical protein
VCVMKPYATIFMQHSLVKITVKITSIDSCGLGFQLTTCRFIYPGGFGWRFIDETEAGVSVPEFSRLKGFSRQRQHRPQAA